MEEEWRVFSLVFLDHHREYVWRTKEIEAFSNVGYRSPEAIKQSKSNGKLIQMTPKSIKFLDINWIEIIF